MKTAKIEHGYTQLVLSGPKKIFKEKVLTKKGQRLITSATTKAEKYAIWAKYGKNKYIKNPDIKPVRFIIHKNKLS